MYPGLNCASTFPCSAVDILFHRHESRRQDRCQALALLSVAVIRRSEIDEPGSPFLRDDDNVGFYVPVNNLPGVYFRQGIQNRLQDFGQFCDPVTEKLRLYGLMLLFSS